MTEKNKYFIFKVHTYITEKTLKIRKKVDETEEHLSYMSEQFADVQFVQKTVEAIVDHPNDVVVDRTVDERGVLLTLKVNPKDMGYIIGRQGQNARAIRILLRIVGARNNARVNLKILEPEGSEHHRRSENDRYRDIDTSAVDMDLS